MGGCKLKINLAWSFWRGSGFGWDFVNLVGQSGGLVCLWDPKVFSAEGSVKNRNYLLIRGRFIGSNDAIKIINVYAPQATLAKKTLWDQLQVEMAG
ncbi:putative Endonuclease/exonuclease/phosphatase superfamily [Helianthus anomalus]